MLVTLSGMLMLVSFEQPQNAYSPILVTLSGMLMLVSFEQPENALSPMLVTLLGMLTLVTIDFFELNTVVPSREPVNSIHKSSFFCSSNRRSLSTPQ